MLFYIQHHIILVNNELLQSQALILMETHTIRNVSFNPMVTGWEEYMPCLLYNPRKGEIRRGHVGLLVGLSTLFHKCSLAGLHKHQANKYKVTIYTF